MTQQYQEVGDDYLSQRFGAPGSQSSENVTTTQLAPLTQTNLAPIVQPKKSEKGPVAPPATMPETEKPNLEGMAESVLRTQEQMKKRPAAEAQNPLDPILDYATQNWEYFAVPAAAVAANYITKTVSPSRRSLVDRMFSAMAPDSTIASPQVTNRIDPVMDTGSSLQKPDLDMSKLDPEMRQIIARSEANRVAKEKDLEFRRQQRQQAAVNEINRVPDTTGMPTAKAPSPIPDVIAKTTPSVVLAPAPDMVKSLSGISTPEIPTVADIGKQSLGLAPVAPPVTVNQIVSEAISPPSEEKKKGRPAGAKNLTPDQRAAAQASKGTNMYLNMFGFEKNDPTSAKSLAAIESTNRFINEALGGKPPASRDPMLNPEGDIGPSGKKFYSGTPEGYRNAYIPWLQENLNTLPPETQQHVLSSMTKGQTADITKIAKGLGLAGLLGASGAAFSAPAQTRTRDVINAVGESLLPIGITPRTLQSGNLGPAQLRAFEEAQKLGSPYRSVPPPQ